MKILIKTVIAFFCLFIPFSFVLGYNNLSGLILLQVEKNGEAWYVIPNLNKRIFLNKPADAYNIMRTYGLGIRKAELQNYLDSSFPSRLMGKILLDVERNGEAYYIYPKNKQAYYLGRPSDAFSIMRNLSLGITNDDLAQIAIVNEELEIVKDEEENNEENEHNQTEEVVEDNKDYEELPIYFNNLNGFVNNINGSQDLVDCLNKYFHIEEREGYIIKKAEEFLNDKYGNQFDFINFSASILANKLPIVNIIRYDYKEGEDIKSNIISIFRDQDEKAKIIYFDNQLVKLRESGGGVRAMIKAEEERLNIKVFRWAYFPVNQIDLSDVISPFTWQY